MRPEFPVGCAYGIVNVQVLGQRVTTGVGDTADARVLNRRAVRHVDENALLRSRRRETGRAIGKGPWAGEGSRKGLDRTQGCTKKGSPRSRWSGRGGTRTVNKKKPFGLPSHTQLPRRRRIHRQIWKRMGRQGPWSPAPLLCLRLCCIASLLCSWLSELGSLAVGLIRDVVIDAGRGPSPSVPGRLQMLEGVCGL